MSLTGDSLPPPAAAFAGSATHVFRLPERYLLDLIPTIIQSGAVISPVVSLCGLTGTDPDHPTARYLLVYASDRGGQKREEDQHKEYTASYPPTGGGSTSHIDPGECVVSMLSLVMGGSPYWFFPLPPGMRKRIRKTRSAIKKAYITTLFAVSAAEAQISIPHTA